jgi:hypothetical protein
MEIIFSDERKPGESILQKMYQAAELCLAKKDLDPERVTVSVTFVSSEENNYPPASLPYVRHAGRKGLPLGQTGDR